MLFGDVHLVMPFVRSFNHSFFFCMDSFDIYLSSSDSWSWCGCNLFETSLQFHMYHYWNNTGSVEAEVMRAFLLYSFSTCK